MELEFCICVLTDNFLRNQQMLKSPKDALENVNHIFCTTQIKHLVESLFNLLMPKEHYHRIIVLGIKRMHEWEKISLMAQLSTNV